MNPKTTLLLVEFHPVTPEYVKGLWEMAQMILFVQALYNNIVNVN